MDIIESDEYCGLIKNSTGIFGPCIQNPDVGEQNFFDACVYDVCAVANDTDAMKKTACRHLETFAGVCEYNSHRLDWRGPADCRK